MVDCDICGESGSMGYTCNRCGGEFCSSHRLPENHECPSLYGKSSEKWFSDKFEGVDESATRSGSRKFDSSRVTRNSEAHSDTTTSRGRSPSSKAPPTASSPDVASDGSVASDERSISDPAAAVDSPSSRASRAGLIAVVILILVPLGTGAMLFIGDFQHPASDSGVSAGTDSDTGAAATTVSTPTPTPDPVGAAALNETEIEQVVHRRVNRIRSREDVGQLLYADRPARKAEAHSEWMANQTTLEHSEEGYYLCLPAGENIAYTYAASDIDTEWSTEVNYNNNETRIGRGIVKMWMHSPPHRKNLLREEYEREGIGIATVEVESRTRIYATQALCGF